MPSRDELQAKVNKLLDFFTEPGTGEKYLKNLEDDLMSLIDQQIREARINEVHNFGNWNADKGIPELWTAIENRLAQLSTKPQEGEGV